MITLNDELEFLLEDREDLDELLQKEILKNENFEETKKGVKLTREMHNLSDKINLLENRIEEEKTMKRHYCTY